MRARLARPVPRDQWLGLPTNAPRVVQLRRELDELDVAQPGEYVVWNLGRESIAVARTQTGELAANYNVCQHRGARILVDDRGCAERFTCPYHGWSYRPDGRLVVVPDNQRFEQPVDRVERSLKRVRVEAALGLVFICMDPDAPPLLGSSGPWWSGSCPTTCRA